jgi:formyl-CoA transferase/CoA:oxalate CoA-transferase
MALALDGNRVIDFTDAEQGPVATMMLGDLGADVIKVERVGERVPHGANLPIFRGVGVYFTALSPNKRDLPVDLKHPEGREIIL